MPIMKILLISRFPPSLGGVETMGVLIAREWAQNPSLEVKVVTDVPGPSGAEPSYELIRCPAPRQLFQLYRWADAVFFNHCYLKLGLPLLWHRKPYVVSMSGTLDTLPGQSLRQKFIRFLLRRQLRKASANIAACQYVRKGNGLPAEVIPNPYDSSIFFTNGTEQRSYDFFFGGRVNQAAKGCLDLIAAFLECRKKTGLPLTLTVAGDGPDLPDMRALAAEAGATGSIRFVGVLGGEALAAEMRRHKVIVVPSRYQEPIGIICLEGIACGCIAVGSAGGGLGESVGPCGFTFPNGNAAALAAAMTRAITLDGSDCGHFRQRAVTHLRQYHPELIAARYLQVLQAA